MATGGAIKAGEAFIELTLRGARGFGQRLTGAIRSMGRLAASAAKVGVALTAAFGAATIAALQKSLRLFVQIGDQVQKMSQRTGVGAAALSELGFAAEQSGATIELVERGFRGMARAIRGLERGLSTQVEAFEALGLMMQDLQGLEPDQQFEAIAQALSEIEDPTRRAGIAMEVLGRAGTELLPLFANGAEGIRNLREQARILGRSVSQEQADAAARLADRWNEIKQAFTGVALQVATALAPAFEDALVSMRNFLVDWKLWLADLQLATANAFIEIGRFLGLGDVEEAARLMSQGFQFRRSFQSARPRPSQRFQELLDSQSAATPIAEEVGDAIQKATDRENVRGRSFGSFAADARQFGVISIGRKQLRTLERIERIQKEVQERLDQTGFLAFI